MIPSKAHLALSAVTSAPARVAGLAHRVGTISINKDADVVLWSSHPLSLGATPSEVIIDGIRQLDGRHAIELPSEGEYDRRNGPSIATVPESKRDPLREQDDGYDFTTERRTSRSGREWVRSVKFVNVREVFVRHGFDVDDSKDELYEVVVAGTEIRCVSKNCPSSSSSSSDAQATKVIDLQGGSLLPSLYAYGPALGLSEITSV